MITICPPHPLVIQVEAGGEYVDIQWTRKQIALNVNNGELVNFQQTFVQFGTNVNDTGEYQVNLVPQNSILATTAIIFNVNLSKYAASFTYLYLLTANFLYNPCMHFRSTVHHLQV